MSTDYRALCAELNTWLVEIAASHMYLSPAAIGRINDVTDRTHIALKAQPEPVAPTDDELDEFAVFWWGPDKDELTVADAIDCCSMTAYGRAFHARWGNYPVKPDSSPADTINQEG